MLSKIPSRLGTATIKFNDAGGLVFELECICGPDDVRMLGPIPFDKPDYSLVPKVITSLMKMFDVKSLTKLKGEVGLVIVDDKSGAVVGFEQFAFSGNGSVMLSDLLI